jgi:DNA-directed RNA polymerase subunit N (RpoN/RPB10)
MVENEERVAQLIHEVQYAKIKEMCAKVVIGFKTLNTILDNLGYRKFCARWISQMLMTDHKQQRVWPCADLEQYEPVGSYFLDSIITRGETWAQLCEPESKQESVDSQHKVSLIKNKFKGHPFMCSIFWDKGGVILE